MSKYDIRNSQIGAVGDNAKSDHNMYIMDVSKNKVKLTEIIKELNDIEKLLLSTTVRDREREKLLIDIQNIKKISEDGNLELVLGKMKSKASQLFYDLSIGVGSGVVASFIYSILNS
ncbi:hypothetical protein ABEW60_25200 [Paenibacillus jamilae]|uniref:hypothetical protein n=1 Tax=Paenibacillus jamilae TaxID=114136 RepID=UPI003D2ACD45